MIEIKDSHFKGPDGNRYFRRNAISLGIGKWGPKREPLLQANYLEVEGNVRYSLLEGKLSKSPPYGIDWARANRADVEATATVYHTIKGTATFDYERAREANLQMIRFHVDGGELTRLLNDADGVRDKMKSEGNDARICSSVWIVVSGELAERFSTGVRFNVKANISEGLSVGVEGGATWSGEERITLSESSVFAYGLHKIDRWKGDLVGDVKDDWQSLG
jgi:hypothetical protein